VYKVFLLANQNNGACPLVDTIGRAGLSCQVGPDLAWVEEAEVPSQPEVVLLDLASVDPYQAQVFIDRCKKLRLPVVAVLPREGVAGYDPSLNPDELVLHPVPDGELLVRVKQAIYRVSGPTGSQLLRAGDLTIDLEAYEVTVRGRRVSLTYKEFQLLVLLASNPGRVYSRELLLSQIWEYDYLGGTRTVDVHVRRLRSKIESPGRSFIETVYLVGYRFKTLS
jgi:DNA-binding response OmpR family regulator